MDLAGGSEQRNPEFTGLHHGRCHSLALPWMGAGGWAHQASWDEEPLTTLRHSGDADPASQPGQSQITVALVIEPHQGDSAGRGWDDARE
jgi:hypothetical protein